MTPLAPYGNFSGIFKHVGEIVGAEGGQSFNEQLLNTVDDNNPVLVGIGNAIKIYISYEFTGMQLAKAYIGLYWLQRVQQEGAGGGEKGTTARGADQIIRKFDAGSQNDCNQTAFFDVVAVPALATAPGVYQQDMLWQQINLPLIDPPIDLGELPVTGQDPLSGTGVVYECKAKADELFLFSMVDPDNDATSPQQRIAVDIVIGADAAGEQK